MALDLTADRAAVDAILDRVLAVSTADETEAVYTGSVAALTRYTRNEIHENVVENNGALNVRAVVGKRVGVASTNQLDAQSISDTVARAVRIAKLAPEDENFPGLPGSDGNVADLPGAYDEATAHATPGERADAVGRIAAIMKHHQLHAAGYVATRSDTIAIANSKGVRRLFRATDASINIKAIGVDSSGYAEGFSRSFSDLDIAKLAETAAKKAVDGATPHPLAPGKYTVILEPAAFREFLLYLSWAGFGAQALDQGSSFMAGHIGERVMGPNVTIRDDFSQPKGDGFPFDFEGVPRQPVTLIERGVAKEVVYDSYYAAKIGHANTGHALPAPNSDGPFPLNIFVQPGQRSQAEIVKDVELGVLMSRTWYIRLVDQKKMLITGMTRDGLFLIEHGRITHGLKNMRFNESIVDALGRCELGSTLSRSESHVLPAARIDDFHFTSGTTF
jgi:predicted Zn-dependent protease